MACYTFLCHYLDLKLIHLQKGRGKMSIGSHVTMFLHISPSLERSGNAVLVVVTIAIVRIVYDLGFLFNEKKIYTYHIIKV